MNSYSGDRTTLTVNVRVVDKVVSAPVADASYTVIVIVTLPSIPAAGVMTKVRLAPVPVMTRPLAGMSNGSDDAAVTTSEFTAVSGSPSERAIGAPAPPL